MRKILAQGRARRGARAGQDCAFEIGVCRRIDLSPSCALGGDVLFVPYTWSHATVNLRTSVGYAVEFDTPLWAPY